jgi:hypothetical protein
MPAFRSRMRLVAMAWLLCQVASLSAFMPENCCATHTAISAAKHAKATPECHEPEPAPAPEPEPGAACPMHHETGAACPMHGAPTGGECCGMSNGCEGPNRPLANLFSFVGIFDAPALSVSAPESAPVHVERPAPLRHRLVSPDAPPPKQ